MDITITTIGALIGLAVAIILIIKNRTCIQYDRRCFCRWVIGGGGTGRNRFLHDNRSTEHYACDSSNRNIGILAGVLIQSGAAVKIADQIIKDFGEKKSIIFSGTCNNDSDSSWCIW